MLRSTRFLPRLVWRTALTLVAVIWAGAPANASRSIVGVCPDGSMFIVKAERFIPCREAKLVEPDEVPPLKGQYLPRPYAWELHNRRNDPNNPYNLIDVARQARAVREAADTANEPAPAPTTLSVSTPPVSAPPSVSTPPVSAPPSVSAQPKQYAAVAPPRNPRPVDLSLNENELRDLAIIVGLAQDQAPAAFSRPGEDGQPGLVLQLARSQAFEARLREGFQGNARLPAGPVVLFAATAAVAQDFHPNLTFVQGHVAYHPDTSDPLQLGVIRGNLGHVAPDEPTLGYAVLPEYLDLAKPIDIYWDDHRLTAKLAP
jgi:hypothetical protein